MAYMSQEKKAKLAPKIKAICKKYKIKASIAVRNHSALVLNIRSGSLDIIGNYNEVAGCNQSRWATTYLDVNPHWYQDHFTGKVLRFFEELMPAMNDGNHDRSDIQTDYFDVGWYVDVNVGQWNKPYRLEA